MIANKKKEYIVLFLICSMLHDSPVLGKSLTLPETRLSFGHGAIIVNVK